MEKNDSPKEILEKIKSAKKILLRLHEGPDGDSLGCCVAMKYVLERDFNADVTLISPDPLPGYLTLFEFNKEVEFGKSLKDFDLKDFDVFLFLDSGALTYWQKNDIEIPKGKTINIDHHPTNAYYGDLNYVDGKRPSGCSVLIDLFKEWGIKFDKELSTRLLVGVYTGSGGFSHDDGESLKDAAFLIDKGADYLKGVVNKIKYNSPLNSKKYFALITNNFKIVDFEEYKVGVSSISQKEIEHLKLNLGDIRGGVNYLQEIGGIDFLFTLTEMDDFIKGSFRSRKNINVSLFAKSMGGGGHKLAAAFRVDKMPLDKAEKRVFEEIKKVGVHKVE